VAPAVVAPGVVAPATVPAPVIPSTVPTNVPPTFREGSSPGIYRAPALPPLSTGLPQRTWTFRPVSAERPAAPAPSELSSAQPKANDGWRASKR
jgi:hypothetical protein